MGRVSRSRQAGSSRSGDRPVVLRPGTGMAWFFAVLPLFFAFALFRGYTGTSTTGGRIGVVISMGAVIVFCAWAALTMVLRRPSLSISASAITYSPATPFLTRATGRPALVLDRSSGTDLQIVRFTRPGRPPVDGLTIPGSGTTLPVPGFDLARIRTACTASGWRFMTGVDASQTLGSPQIAGLLVDRKGYGASASRSAGYAAGPLGPGIASALQRLTGKGRREGEESLREVVFDTPSPGSGLLALTDQELALMAGHGHTKVVGRVPRSDIVSAVRLGGGFPTSALVIVFTNGHGWYFEVRWNRARAAKKFLPFLNAQQPSRSQS